MSTRLAMLRQVAAIDTISLITASHYSVHKHVFSSWQIIPCSQLHMSDRQARTRKNMQGRSVVDKTSCKHLQSQQSCIHGWRSVQMLFGCFHARRRRRPPPQHRLPINFLSHWRGGGDRINSDKLHLINRLPSSAIIMVHNVSVYRSLLALTARQA